VISSEGFDCCARAINAKAQNSSERVINDLSCEVRDIICSIVDAGSFDVVSNRCSEERGIKPEGGGSRESYNDKYNGGGSSVSASVNVVRIEVKHTYQPI